MPALFPQSKRSGCGAARPAMPCAPPVLGGGGSAGVDSERLYVERTGGTQTASRPATGGAPEATGASPGPPSIVVRRCQCTVVVTIHGELDTAGARRLDDVLADLIDGQGNLFVVVDLHDATATDADSLSVFANAAQSAHRRGGTMGLSEPPAVLRRALELRGLQGLTSTGTRNWRANA